MTVPQWRYRLPGRKVLACLSKKYHLNRDIRPLSSSLSEAGAGIIRNTAPGIYPTGYRPWLRAGCRLPAFALSSLEKPTGDQRAGIAANWRAANAHTSRDADGPEGSLNACLAAPPLQAWPRPATSINVATRRPRRLKSLMSIG